MTYPRAMEQWTFARTAWDEHFQPLRDAGLTLERVEQSVYWETHERALRAHFPPEFFFDLPELRPPEVKAAQARIAEARGGTPLYDFCVARAGGEVAALFSGNEQGDGVYRMWHTNIHPAHRRKGLYRKILAGTIGYTRALGFDVIASEHAPGNNPILIAKLGAGFRIVSLEVDPAVGVSVHLRYYHNPEHLAAYELRCGLARLTPGLRAHAFGAFTTLAAQVAGGSDG
jgi:GNAT superfamily N-acetyltransferase